MNTAERSRFAILNTTLILALCAISAGLAGCLDRELKPLNPCLVSGSTKQIAVTNVDKVDLLFTVDDSGSMREEQGALKDQFPKLINTLVTGMRVQANGGMDPNPFPPAKDLHLAVVSVNMGLIGIQGIGGCSGATGVGAPGFGDDGIFRHQPAAGATGCQPMYPNAFLSYKAGGSVTAAQLSTDFACIAQLGTGGCGFEQQLESPLKALWPSVDIDVKTGKQIMPNRITFLTDMADPMLAFGHGDRENRGFLRNDPIMGLSLIAIVVVTDEEDCSSKITEHFTPQQYLNMSSKYYNEDLNLRCFYNPDNLYPSARYINGFKALRDGNENLVVFAAITGVPPDLVDDKAYKAVTWDNDASREGFYTGILNDNRMMNKVDMTRQPGDGNLVPSCVTTTSSATPPRRIVEVARGFGKNGLVKSICNTDQFGPAMDAIIEIIAKQLGEVCLDRPLVRKADGKVTCNVVWELPPANMAPTGTPTDCGGQRPYLKAPADGHATVSDRGGKICTVDQLPVKNQAVPLTQGDGWYYDDFSDDVKKACVNGAQRTGYTPNAKPPSGVVVKLECLNETQTLVSNRTDVDDSTPAPDIGTACDKTTNGAQVMGQAADAVCAVHLKDGTTDTKMFCHPQLNVCVRSCSGDSDCPPAWVCDKRGDSVQATVTAWRAKGAAYCVNPTCGTQ